MSEGLGRILYVNAHDTKSNRITGGTLGYIGAQAKRIQDRVQVSLQKRINWKPNTWISIMLKMKIIKSNGTFGEQRAEWYFASVGWKMFRTQPPTRRVWKGKLTIVNEKTGHGIADYTGYDIERKYIACEVKEFDGFSIPCSRLDKNQRSWMSRIPTGSAYVLGVDPWGRCYVWDFKQKGSYDVSQCLYHS
jgi:hypothetical protein